MFLSLRSNWDLIIQLARREVIGRYRGSWMGLAWSIINPAILLAVYTFFFLVIFKARWHSDQPTSTSDFAILVFVGLIIHGLFAECVNKAPYVIQSNANYVKKVVFPLETLVPVSMVSALFHLAMSFIVLIIAQLLIGGGIHWTAIFMPLVLLPLVLTALGISWWLASLGVFIRDVGQITGFMMTVLLFMSPIFYPISSMPEPYRTFLLLNPLTFIIEQARAVTVYGKLPDFFGLAYATWIGVIVAWLGYAWFQKTRKAFADVI